MSVPVVDELRRAAQQREQLAEAYARKAHTLRHEARGFEREARRVERLVLQTPPGATETRVKDAKP